MANRINASRTPTQDFTQPQPFSDVVLIVGSEGKRLHVNKTYLAMHSPVFKAMFFSDFSEKSKAEVELKKVKADEFVAFLHAIYPSQKRVTEGSVESLLELADRFQVQRLVELCEESLLKQTKQIPLPKKFLMAESFGLYRLQEWCTGQLRSLADTKALEKTVEYSQLSDKSKVAVLEKAMHFCSFTCEGLPAAPTRDTTWPTTPSVRLYRESSFRFASSPETCGLLASSHCRGCEHHKNIKREGLIDMRDVMRMEEYRNICDKVKLALLKKALGP